MPNLLEFKIGSEPNIVLEILDEDRNAVDISGATTMQLRFSDKADTPTEHTKTAVHTTDGTDGKLQYRVSGSEFAVGQWWVEAHVIVGTTILSSTTSFRVLPSLL